MTITDHSVNSTVDGAAAATLRTQLAIRATPAEIWKALIDGSITPAYYLGFEAHYDLTAGAAYSYTAGGGDMITGRVLELEVGKRLMTTFSGHWDPAVAALSESVVTFSVFEPFMPMPGVTFLACEHRGLPTNETAQHLEIGWVSILSGLKTLLETGSPLSGPGH